MCNKYTSCPNLFDVFFKKRFLFCVLSWLVYIFHSSVCCWWLCTENMMCWITCFKCCIYFFISCVFIKGARFCVWGGRSAAKNDLILVVGLFVTLTKKSSSIFEHMISKPYSWCLNGSSIIFSVPNINLRNFKNSDFEVECVLFCWKDFRPACFADKVVASEVLETSIEAYHSCYLIICFPLLQTMFLRFFGRLLNNICEFFSLLMFK